MPKQRFKKSSGFSAGHDARTHPFKPKICLVAFFATLVALRLGYLLGQGRNESIATGLLSLNPNEGAASNKNNLGSSTSAENTSKIPFDNLSKYDQNRLDPEVEELNKKPIYFLVGIQNINDPNDAFSASWLQRREEFMEMNATEIVSCEDAAFNAFWGPVERARRLRMTVDWFDFCIEHMSHWHKLLNLLQGEEQVFQAAVSKFDQYVSTPLFGNDDSYFEDMAFRETIAIIAFKAYANDKAPDKAYSITVKYLCATIESLRRVGFGRVVVVGLDPNELKIVSDTVQHWQSLHSETVTRQSFSISPGEGVVGMIGHLEIAYVQASMEIARARWVQKNVPKAAVGGLHKAFEYADIPISKRTQAQKDYILSWLGKKEDYRYVYLTEPDCILNVRPSSLRQLKEEVDRGNVLSPHRLQPVPHEEDAKTLEEWRYLPKKFAPVLELDAIGNHDVCCDDWKGHGTKPGLPPNFPDCGNFWYMCDFHPDSHKQGGRAHERLKPYSLMRLKRGTGVVNLASNEHGRPCKPQERSTCSPKS